MDPRIEKSIAVIKEHFRENLLLEDLYKPVFMSSSRFSHVFFQEVGLPPMYFLRDMRIKNAAALLESTSDTVASVAQQVGYCSLGAFGRQFKMRTGETPVDYRISRQARDGG